MKWSEELSVKIVSIDNQHKKLIEIFNNFTDSINKNSSRERVLEAIKGLKDYTVYHFSAEEKLMITHKYPGYDLHKKEHDSFVKTVQDYEDRFNKGKLLLTVEISNFINNWICKHIMNVDGQYSEFLISKGVR